MSSGGSFSILRVLHLIFSYAEWARLISIGRCACLSSLAVAHKRPKVGTAQNRIRTLVRV